MNIARAIIGDRELDIETVGIRPGEKIHEQMIGLEDAPHCYEHEAHYKILPAIHDWSSDPSRINSGVKVPEGFVYTSDSNAEWMSVEGLQEWIEAHRGKIGL